MRAKFINEALAKNTWEHTPTPGEKYDDELINLVQNAYAKTPAGSFVNAKKDLIEPDWVSIDFDDEPDIDATVFYRGSRANEPWVGKKIQGIGHDGSREAINMALTKLRGLLSQNGYWVEASDALEHIMYKLQVPYVNSEEYAQRIFPKTEVTFIGDRGKYHRKLTNEKVIKETIFGKPKLKK